jgi:cytochrome c oxidase subunit 2
MKRLHRWPVGLVATLCCACGGEYTQSSLDPVTDFGDTIHGLYTTVFWWTVVILAVVWIVLGYVLVRFRERPGAPLPKQTHGHLGVEVAWTLGPAVIVIAIAVPTIQALFRTQLRDPEAAYVIDVVGHQFWWEFRYPEGVVTANELHLPVGRPVSLRLHSVDVIHSFWVPQLGGKRDVNPMVQRPEGAQPRYNWLHFTIQEPGVYSGQCAEFCGPSHALMGTRVVAEPEADFQAWLGAWSAGAPLPAPAPAAAPAPADGAGGGPAAAGGAAPGTAAGAPPANSPAAAGAAPTPAPAAPPQGGPAAPAAPPQSAPASPAAANPQDRVAQGQQLFFTNVCVGCHAIQGTPAMSPVGPNLTLFGRRSTLAAGWLQNNEDNLVRWIMSPTSVKPGAMMPGVGDMGALTEDQVRLLAAYLLSLR